MMNTGVTIPMLQPSLNTSRRMAMSALEWVKSFTLVHLMEMTTLHILGVFHTTTLLCNLSMAGT